MTTQLQHLEVLAYSMNGVKVCFEPDGSHTATHFEDNPELRPLVEGLIGTLSLTGAEIRGDFNLGKVIGYADVVEITDQDHIVYAVRKNREADGLVPFTKSRSQGDETNCIALHLKPTDFGPYILLSAWFGKYGEDEPFPGSSDSNDKSVAYWTKHAFVYGSQSIVPSSEKATHNWG